MCPSNIGVLFSARTVVVECQVECFNGCGTAALTMGINSDISECCNTNGGVAFIDLQNEPGGCQTCVDVGSELKHIATAINYRI